MKTLPKADPTAPMKFQPLPALNNAVAASELAQRLESEKAEADRLRATMAESAEDMRTAMRELSTLQDVWGDGTGECVYTQSLKVSDALKRIQERLRRESTSTRD